MQKIRLTEIIVLLLDCIHIQIMYKSFLSILLKFVCILGFVEKLVLKVPY